MRSWLAPSILPDSIISSGTVVVKNVRMMMMLKVEQQIGRINAQ